MSSSEQRLRDLVTEVTGRDASGLGLDDDFFDHGRGFGGRATASHSERQNCHHDHIKQTFHQPTSRYSANRGV